MFDKSQLFRFTIDNAMIIIQKQLDIKFKLIPNKLTCNFTLKWFQNKQFSFVLLCEKIQPTRCIFSYIDVCRYTLTFWIILYYHIIQENSGSRLIIMVIFYHILSCYLATRFMVIPLIFRWNFAESLTSLYINRLDYAISFDYGN